jgi:signal transduction histidine kinase
VSKGRSTPPPESNEASELLRAFSHAVKNDIHSMAVNLEALEVRLTKRLPAEQAESVLKHLVIVRGDLGNLKARLEGAAQLFDIDPAEPQINSAEEIIRTAMREVRQLAADAGVRMVVSGESAASVFVDGAQVVRGVFEVLKNAVEAAPAATTVEIQVRDLGRAIEILVSNPMPSDVYPPSKAPAPFHTRKPGHAGIGLLLAKRLLLQNRATIELAPGKGRYDASLRIPKGPE